MTVPLMDAGAFQQTSFETQEQKLTNSRCIILIHALQIRFNCVVLYLIEIEQGTVAKLDAQTGDIKSGVL